MKKATNSIKITIILFFALVLILAGCKEKGDADVPPPYVLGGEYTHFPGEIPNMPPELIKGLQKLLGPDVDIPPFILIPDGTSEGLTVAKREDYERRTPDPGHPRPAKDLTSLLSISILFFKNSPGCAWISVGNSQEFVCEKV